MKTSPDLKKNEPLDASFWEHRWQTGKTGWDMGQASPPLAAYVDHYANKNAAILIPGCGNAYEASYLLEKGFTHITLIDIAPEAVKRLQEKFKDAPQVTVLHGDFFQHQGSYDLILEQTFFCALTLQQRPDYVQKMSGLLKENGKLTGVLFDTDFGLDGPPFGGSKEDYDALFQPYFHIKTMAPCYNSIPPRAGSELFIELERRK